MIGDNRAELRDCFVELSSLQISETDVHARHDVGWIALQDLPELSKGGVRLSRVDQGETQIVARFQIRRVEFNRAPACFDSAGEVTALLSRQPKFIPDERISGAQMGC